MGLCLPAPTVNKNNLAHRTTACPSSRTTTTCNGLRRNRILLTIRHHRHSSNIADSVAVVLLCHGKAPPEIPSPAFSPSFTSSRDLETHAPCAVTRKRIPFARRPVMWSKQQTHIFLQCISLPSLSRGERELSWRHYLSIDIHFPPHYGHHPYVVHLQSTIPLCRSLFIIPLCCVRYRALTLGCQRFLFSRLSSSSFQS